MISIFFNFALASLKHSMSLICGLIFFNGLSCLSPLCFNAQSRFPSITSFTGFG